MCYSNESMSNATTVFFKMVSALEIKANTDHFLINLMSFIFFMYFFLNPKFWRFQIFGLRKVPLTLIKLTLFSHNIYSKFILVQRIIWRNWQVYKRFRSIYKTTKKQVWSNTSVNRPSRQLSANISPLIRLKYITTEQTHYFYNGSLEGV